jgi:hypothetical protein
LSRYLGIKQLNYLLYQLVMNVSILKITILAILKYINFL